MLNVNKLLYESRFKVKSVMVRCLLPWLRKIWTTVLIFVFGLLKAGVDHLQIVLLIFTFVFLLCEMIF